jgi:hypothetical protein
MSGVLNVGKKKHLGAERSVGHKVLQLAVGLGDLEGAVQTVQIAVGRFEVAIDRCADLGRGLEPVVLVTPFQIEVWRYMSDRFLAQ